MKRPPIVVVVGHVDHGKTSLLDYIRKTNVVEKEAGRITQSIGAYEIIHNGQKITFIDTPGHEAFSQMRSRGAHIADLAILVVAADEGVKEQTREAIKTLKTTETPFIVAATKIDKNNADINRVKNDLLKEEVLLEGYGGNVSWKGISAVTGEGIGELLDLIVLAADLEDLHYEPGNPGKGYIIETKMDNRRGAVVSVIIIDGQIKVGDEVATGAIKTKIRSLENWKGERIAKAEPCVPVLIIGFKEMPSVGEEITVGGEAKEAVVMSKSRIVVTADNSQNLMKIILKADSVGSLEALAQIIENLPLSPNCLLNVVDKSIGEITDGDIKWAIGDQAKDKSNAFIIGFRVKVSKAADNLAKIHNVSIITSDVIYDLVKKLEEWVKESTRDAVVIGDLELLAVFGKKGGKRQVIGGRVVAGEIRANASCEIERNNKVFGTARIINLQKQKEDVIKVEAGNECGLLVASDVDLRVGDHLIYRQ